MLFLVSEHQEMVRTHEKKSTTENIFIDLRYKIDFNREKPDKQMCSDKFYLVKLLNVIEIALNILFTE
jgi:hypothetical protein